MKTAIILPGWREEPTTHYNAIAKSFTDNGWEQVLIHQLDWEHSSMEQLTDDFLAAVPADSTPLTLLGFSLGAMTALIASSKLDVEHLLLCSPSGYFQEYTPLFTAEDLSWTAKHLGDYERYSAQEVIKRAKVAHGYVLAGEKELAQWPDFRQWIGDLKRQTNWQYYEIPGVGHDIEHTLYQAKIHETIRSI